MKTNKTTENKCNNYEHLRTKNTSMKHNSDEEYYNFSDSSLELFDTFKQKSKKNKNFKQTSNSNIVFDIIDLTNESDMKLKRNKNMNFLNDLSVCNISSSSNESFKSATSILSNSNNINNLENINNGKQNNNSLTKIIHFDSENNLSDSNKSLKLEYNITSTMSNNKQVEHSNYQNNYATPKEKQIKNNHLIKSAKLLDRIYGKEWRSVDGVIKNSKKKKLSDEDFVNYNE